MPATPRNTGARLGARRSITATLTLGLVMGFGLSTSPAAQAAPASQATQVGQTAPVSQGASAERAEKSQKKAQRKARQRKRARIRARKARWAEIRAIGRAKGVAMAQRGDSYGYGASGPNSFDCSGLIQYAYHRAGFRGMPRSSAAQAGHTRRIAKSAMRPGDLMFFANGGGVYHVGMFAGRGPGGVPLMVHSSRPGTPVQVSQPWTSSWFAGTVR